MTPTIEEKIKFVREKVIEILPEIGEVKVFECGECGNDDQMFYRQIRLSDILLAIEYSLFKGTIEFSTYGDEFHIGVYDRPNRDGYYSKAYYDLRDDNFDHQTNETKEFIWELLK